MLINSCAKMNVANNSNRTAVVLYAHRVNGIVYTLRADCQFIVGKVQK